MILLIERSLGVELIADMFYRNQPDQTNSQATALNGKSSPSTPQHVIPQSQLYSRITDQDDPQAYKPHRLD